MLFLLLLIIFIALLFRWLRIIALNSNIQVEQNKKIIELLTKNSGDKVEDVLKKNE